MVPIRTGEHLWETKTETCSNHSPAHPVSVRFLQQQQRHHNADKLCSSRIERKKKQRSGRSVGEMETLIKAKMGFVYFFHFPLSTDV